MDRRQFLSRSAGGATALLATGLAGCAGRGDGGGDSDGDSDGDGAGDGDASPTPTIGDGELSISAAAFDDAGTIPARYTCDGENVSPELAVEGVPDGAGSLALVVDDPDAPGSDPFVHWLLWNVPPGTETIPRGVPQGETVDALDGARQGTNGSGSVGYFGPCPPTDDGAHTYRFTLSALDGMLDVSAAAKRDALAEAMADRMLARARITGEYDRN